MTTRRDSKLNTMKVFHVLVGYLAATALPPFHPFAFAAPGIHYDGYVDITQNPSHNIDGALTGTKHVLGDTEKSQTVTSGTGNLNGYVNATQNSSGDAVPTNIEARQLPVAVVIPLVGIILSTIVFVVTSIVWISEDDPVRAKPSSYRAL